MYAFKNDVSKGNLILMDEPTNHLDLESITALNNAMAEYRGSLLFTSHDHELVNTVANRIIEITPAGTIDKMMSYDEYLKDDKVISLRRKCMPDNNLVKNVNFKLTVPNPNDQYLNIECTIPTAQREIELQLPSWRPGRYEITNFAKNIRGFKVLNDQNQTIPFHKNSKDSWIVSCKETSAITVKYQYYSNELNAGSTF